VGDFSGCWVKAGRKNDGSVGEIVFNVGFGREYLPKCNFANGIVEYDPFCREMIKQLVKNRVEVCIENIG
jgi:hypothetical protein